MTNDKTIEILYNMKTHAEHTDDIELIDACETAIKAIKENKKLKETVEKIRDEIQEKQGWADSWNMGRFTSLNDAIKIIDKHMEELA